MRDVCRICNSELGMKVDHLALEDWRIIDAIRKLNLPELHAKILDRANWISKDLTDDTPILKTTSKGGSPKINPQSLASGGMMASEKDLTRILSEQLHAVPHEKADPKDIAANIAKVREKLIALKPGATYQDPLQGEFKKHLIESECSFKETNRASHRLVAKIAYELSFIFLGTRLHLLKDQLEPLRLHARYGDPLSPDTIRLPPGSSLDTFDPSRADFFHQIFFSYEEWGYSIDILLFGVVDFRIVLIPKTPEGHGPIEDGDDQVAWMTLAMTFAPGQPRTKLLGKALVGQEKCEFVTLHSAL